MRHFCSERWIETQMMYGTDVLLQQASSALGDLIMLHCWLCGQGYFEGDITSAAMNGAGRKTGMVGRPKQVLKSITDLCSLGASQREPGKCSNASPGEDLHLLHVRRSKPCIVAGHLGIRDHDNVSGTGIRARMSQADLVECAYLVQFRIWA